MRAIEPPKTSGGYWNIVLHQGVSNAQMFFFFFWKGLKVYSGFWGLNLELSNCGELEALTSENRMGVSVVQSTLLSEC